MKIDETQKENIKWLMGIAAAMVVTYGSISVNNYVRQNEQIKQKIDDVHLLVVDINARTKVQGEEIVRERQKVLDLQLANQRIEYYIILSEQRRVEELNEKKK